MGRTEAVEDLVFLWNVVFVVVIFACLVGLIIMGMLAYHQRKEQIEKARYRRSLKKWVCREPAIDGDGLVRERKEVVQIGSDSNAS